MEKSKNYDAPQLEIIRTGYPCIIASSPKEGGFDNFDYSEKDII